MRERSPGKDTPTGHWEMMGCPLEFEFPTFPSGFPTAWLEEFVSRAQLPGVLGNEVASGTEILERLGNEHLATGKPIVYTSADSVFQVAAHAAHFGLERLYTICALARQMMAADGPLGVVRVIARPFVDAPPSTRDADGNSPRFHRTYDRRDWSLPPPGETVLDRLFQAGIAVIGLGKIHDIFSGRGLSRSIHTGGNRDGMRRLEECMGEVERGLLFVNLVDFDTLFGHRRDPVGYAHALEDFDSDWGRLRTLLRREDLVLFSADHGNDPTRPGSDHTREYVPVLAAGEAVRAGVDLGTRASFADLGATVEEALGQVPRAPGRSFLGELL
jgi:phosphopentomutase